MNYFDVEVADLDSVGAELDDDQLLAVSGGKAESSSKTGCLGGYFTSDETL